MAGSGAGATVGGVVVGGGLLGAVSPPVDYRIDTFVLDVVGRESLDVDIAESLTRAELELTVEGASTLTLTLEDQDRKLLRSDTLTRWAWGDKHLDEEGWLRIGRAIDARLGGYDYRLVAVSKQGTALTLTFEDRIVSRLRGRRGARKVSRGKRTRAQFVQMLADEVKADGGITLVCPELRTRQPIKSAAEKTSKAKRTADGKRGIAEGAKLKVKGRAATASAVRMMERVLDVAASCKASPRATLALVVACIVENEWKNKQGAGADAISWGILQAIPGRSAGPNGTITLAQAKDPEYSARAALVTPGFTSKGGLIKLARENPSWTAGKLAAVAINGGGDPQYVQKCDALRDEARAIIAAYDGGGGRASKEYRKAYEFARGKTETSWDAMGRLAEEVGWRRFIREGRLWFMSEEDLFAQRAVFRVREGASGVDVLDFDVDLGSRDPVAEVRLSARTNRWAALPGMVVIVEEAGPADGRWLVSSIRRDLMDLSGACDVVLRKPIPELAEPAPETGTRSSDEDDEDGKGGGSKVDRVYREALAISKRELPYVYGGGHGTLGKPSGGGYDCSGYVSACLHAAGIMGSSSPQVSGWFASSWGKPGKGRTMTVWANAEHVYIEFHGRRGKRADTSPYGSGGKGPRMRYTTRPSAGLTPRHWPGT